MEFKKNPALWTSVILHLVVLLAVFLGTLVDLFKPKEKPHVFQMVNPPGAQSSASQAATPPDAREMPVMPIQPDLMPVPAVVMPKPAPVPKVAPTPKVQPQAVHKPKTLSYEEFLKQNPIQEPVQRKPQPKVNVKVPHIDTSKVRESLQGLLQNHSRVDSGMSAAEQDALTQYGARLNSLLNRAWLKPANLAGVRLVATVVFDVSASGRISNVRLRPASGNSAFDASVLAAFRQVTGIGPTPSGQSHVFTMSFRMVE